MFLLFSVAMSLGSTIYKLRPMSVPRVSGAIRSCIGMRKREREREREREKRENEAVERAKSREWQRQKRAVRP